MHNYLVVQITFKLRYLVEFTVRVIRELQTTTRPTMIVLISIYSNGRPVKVDD